MKLLFLVSFLFGFVINVGNSILNLQIKLNSEQTLIVSVVISSIVYANYNYGNNAHNGYLRYKGYSFPNSVDRITRKPSLLDLLRNAFSDMYRLASNSFSYLSSGVSRQDGAIQIAPALAGVGAIGTKLYLDVVAPAIEAANRPAPGTPVPVVSYSRGCSPTCLRGMQNILGDVCFGTTCVCAANMNTAFSACGSDADRCESVGCRCGNAVCEGTTDTCTSGTCMCGANAACATTSDTCTDGDCMCGTNAACSGANGVCTNGGCCSATCAAATTDTCDNTDNMCKCGTNAACDPSGANGVCTKGGCCPAACTGTTDTCDNSDNTCKCGTNAACSGANSVCTKGGCCPAACTGTTDTCDNTDNTCKCGTNAACSGDFPVCTNGHCLAS